MLAVGVGVAAGIAIGVWAARPARERPHPYAGREEPPWTFEEVETDD